MGHTHSKRLQKTEIDPCKALIKEALGNEHTRGFDLDSIYGPTEHRGYVLFEYLTCDRENLSPEDSHPNRYFKQNWQKFKSLWDIRTNLNTATPLGAELILVNHETQEHAEQRGGERQVKVMRVIGGDFNANGHVQTETLLCGTVGFFSKWLKRINDGESTSVARKTEVNLHYSQDSGKEAGGNRFSRKLRSP